MCEGLPVSSLLKMSHMLTGFEIVSSVPDSGLNEPFDRNLTQSTAGLMLPVTM